MHRTTGSGLWLALLGVTFLGCGSSQFSPTGNVRNRGQNTLVVLDATPDARFQGQGTAVAHVTARGYDAEGKQIYGPVEEVYDEELVFQGFPDRTHRVLLSYKRGQGYPLATHEEAVDFVNDDDGVIVLNSIQPKALATADRPTFTVRIQNNSDYPDDQVFVSVNGKNDSKTAFYYVRFGAHDKNSSQPFEGLDKADQYSQALNLLTPEGPRTYSFQCPRENLVSGRIYLSFGRKLKGLGLNNPADPLSLQLPSATGAPDAQTLYEFMELSATRPTDLSAPQVFTLFANTSVVDFFSIGLGMRLDYHDNGVNKSEAVGFVDNARSQILAEFDSTSTPNEFKNYIRKDGSQAILRILSPVQAISLAPAGALSQFLDSAIDEAWTHYAGVALNITDDLPGHTYGYTYTGLPILGGILQMTCTSKPSGDTAGGELESLGEVCNLPKPTSRIVFFCDDNQSPPLALPDRDTYRNAGSQGHKRLVSLIGAALNRGVFSNYRDWASATKFYTRTDGRYNHFSAIMHKFALDGKVYGFGYDDLYGQDPTLAWPLAEVNQVVLTIPKIPRL